MTQIGENYKEIVPDQTDRQTRALVFPWRSLGIAHIFPLLYHRCFGGIIILDLTLLNSSVNLDAAHFSYHEDGENSTSTQSQYRTRMCQICGP